MATKRRKGFPFPPGRSAPAPAPRGADYSAHLRKSRGADVSPMGRAQAPVNLSDGGPESTRTTLPPAEQDELDALTKLVRDKSGEYTKSQRKQDRFKYLLAKQAGVSS